MEKNQNEENDKIVQNEAEEADSEKKRSDAPIENKEPDNQNSADEKLQKKVICSLAYLFGILFFLPLVVYPNDDFAKFHANQALVVLLTVVIGEVIFGILSIIPAVGIVFSILCGVFGLLMLIACILAILGVVREEKYELPIIGKFKLIK